MPARPRPTIEITVAVICFAIIAGLVFFYDGRGAPKVAMKPDSGPPPAAVAPVTAPPSTVRPGPGL